MKVQTVLIGIILIILAAAPGYYFYSRYQHSQELLKHPEQAAKEERDSLVKKIGTLVMLPSKEDPTIATVSDKEKLKDQPFFKNAENGDRVLVFTTSKKAVLYRPSVNKVIDMVTISLTDQNTIVPASLPSGKARVVIYNGTSTPKLANAVEKNLTESFSYVTVTKKDNANSFTYKKTLVIDLKGDLGKMSEAIAGKIKADVAPLPKGEAKPDADVLIIIGENFVQ
jgi:hypothetical protein